MFCTKLPQRWEDPLQQRVALFDQILNVGLTKTRKVLAACTMANLVVFGHRSYKKVGMVGMKRSAIS